MFHPVPLAHELADVQLAPLAELGGAGIAEVRVVLPHRQLRRAVRAVKMHGNLMEHMKILRVHLRKFFQL